MSVIYLFLIFDYLLTYIGIRLDIIEEANIFMVWLFDKPLLQGLLIRMILSGVVILPFYYVKKHCKYYKKVFGLIIMVYILVMVLHIRWILVI